MRRMLDEQEVINLINEYGRDTQVQADWSQTDAEAVDYIKNKPTIPMVDQVFDGTSANAQSGAAIQSVLGDIESLLAAI